MAKIILITGCSSGIGRDLAQRVNTAGLHRISSVVGKLVAPTNGTYSATKFALKTLSDALRLGQYLILDGCSQAVLSHHNRSAAKCTNLITWADHLAAIMTGISP